MSRRGAKVLQHLDANTLPVPAAGAAPPHAPAPKKAPVAPKSSPNAVVTQLSAENETLKARTAELQAQLDSLTSELAKVKLAADQAARKEKKERKAAVEAAAVKPAPVGVDGEALKKAVVKTKPPKHPMSAYLFFCAEQRTAPEVAAMSFQEASKMLGAQWKALEVEKKEKYVKMAEGDKERYKKEMEAYKPIKEREEAEERAIEVYVEKSKQEAAMRFYEEALKQSFGAADEEKTDGGKKKKAKDPNAPKRNLSAYMYFCNERREEIRRTEPQRSVVEISKMLGAEWKVLEGKKGGRDKWVVLAEKDKNRYDEAVRVYRAQKKADDEAEKGRREAGLLEEKRRAIEMYGAQANQENVKVANEEKKAAAGKKKGTEAGAAAGTPVAAAGAQ